MDLLTKKLISDGVLTTGRIIDAFCKVIRADFVLPQDISLAEVDAPLPIGFDQTISQPSTVAFMIELLKPEVGQKVLDVGSGSGWTTALLGAIVGDEGSVVGVEVVPELVGFGQNNINKYPELNAKILPAVNEIGLPSGAPYDRILVSAAATKFPEELARQLRVGGRMVLPILNSIWRVDRIAEDKYLQDEFPGFVFVPLLE